MASGRRAPGRRLIELWRQDIGTVHQPEIEIPLVFRDNQQDVGLACGQENRDVYR